MTERRPAPEQPLKGASSENLKVQMGVIRKADQLVLGKAHCSRRESLKGAIQCLG